MIDYLNHVFGKDEVVKAWWTSSLHSALKTFFHFSDYPFDTFGVDFRREVELANDGKGDKLLFQKVGWFFFFFFF